MNRKRILICTEGDEGFHVVEQFLGRSDSFDYLGMYSGGVESLLPQLRKRKADVVLLHMPDHMHPSIIGEIKKCGNLKVVVISSKQDKESILLTLKSGADGYLSKHVGDEEIASVMNPLADGGVALSSSVARTIVMNFWKSAKSPLTPTETSVLKYMSEGYAYTGIAQKLSISKETAKTHTKNIYRKLEVHRKSEALKRAYHDQLIN